MHTHSQNRGDGSPPTIPVGAESSPPGYTLGIMWDRDHHHLVPSTLQATARTYMYSNGIFSDGPTTSERLYKREDGEIAG
jgi:hypothetical protein